MSHLLRSHAPITDAGWAMLDAEAAERLTAGLGARRLVDFSGPHGWKHSALNLGRTEGVAQTPVGGVSARRRRVLPLVELRAEFHVSRDELQDGERGALDVDLAELDDAAHRMAMAENIAVLHGWPEVGITGIGEAAPHSPIPLGENADQYAGPVAEGLEVLRKSGIDGPYGLALGPDEYTSVMRTSERGGYPLLDHLHKILGGPIVWSPGARGAVLLSLRGGDFLLDVGQDLSLGYRHHDGDSVRLYLEESLGFVVATPEAAVVLCS